MNQINLKLNPKVFFPNLDGLRTVAFLMVYIQHGLWGGFQLLDIQSDIFNKFIYGVANGATGVSVFFVLSGFLITYLLLTEKKDNGKINLWFFYIRRILRIWPLFFAVLIFGFLIYPNLKLFVGIESNLASRPLYYFTFLSNFDVIYIQKFHPGADAMIESITWSVSIEEQFYLLWPLLFISSPKRYYRTIILFIIAVCLLFRYINKDDGFVLYFHTLSVCADLAVGGLCAYYSLFSQRFINFFNSIRMQTIISVYACGILWMLYGNDILDHHTGPVFGRFIVTLFFAFIILEQNFSKNSFFKFSESRTLSFWGKYTYGLYLLHPIALLIIDVNLRMFKISYKENFVTMFVYGIAALFLSLLMSYLSYEYFEARFLKLKEKFSFIHKPVGIAIDKTTILVESSTAVTK